MRKLYFLILAIVLVFITSFISNSHANGPSLYEQERSDAIARSLEASFNVLQKSNYEVRNAREEFKVREAFCDKLNMTHVRMDQHYQGVKVFQGELITHFKADGTLSSITGDYYKKIDISTTPNLSAAEAIAVAAEKFGRGLSAEPTAELIILPKGDKYYLTYRTELADVNSDSPADNVYFISAKSGKVLFQYSNLETQRPGGGTPSLAISSGSIPVGTVPIDTDPLSTGKGLYVGTVTLVTNSLNTGSYEMRDLMRGNTSTNDMHNFTDGNGSIFTDTTNIWGNGSNSDRATAGVDAHYGIQVAFDYYQNVHGRNGIADNGKGTFNRVHYGSNYNNAFWSSSCFCLTYGDGDGVIFSPLVSTDVAGHEMTHGITGQTANLTYSGQSGALNEATSDIFGTCIEFYANNPNAPGNYLIAEQATLRRLASKDPDPNGGKYLRNMAHPKYDGNSIDNYSLYNGQDIHYTSGIANNFFYLLCEGGTNDTSRLGVTGIGRAKAEKIWYRALTVYMTSGTNFAGARMATLKAAGDLYGVGGVEYKTVDSAWVAVGVGVD